MFTVFTSYSYCSEEAEATYLNQLGVTEMEGLMMVDVHRKANDYVGPAMLPATPDGIAALVKSHEVQSLTSGICNSPAFFHGCEADKMWLELLMIKANLI